MSNIYPLLSATYLGEHDPDTGHATCGRCLAKVRDSYSVVLPYERLAIWAYRQGYEPWKFLCGGCWDVFHAWLKLQPQSLQETYTGRWSVQVQVEETT